MRRSLAVVFGTQATIVQLYPDWDKFVFDQGHVTKDQELTMLVLLSKSLGI